MLRKLQALVALSVCTVTLTAAAQDPTGDPIAEGDADPEAPAPEAAAPEEPAVEAPVDEAPTSEPAADDEAPSEQATDRAAVKKARVETSVEEPTGAPASGQATETPEDWQTFAKGYFRAPMTIGISQRRSPDDPNGPAQTQYSYGPNRTVDANYYSFAYTRLQEQDWAEIYIGAKKKHVEAAVGLMGSWYQGTGFRNLDSGWMPALAYVTLDTDFALGGLEPNIAVTGGAFWPKFGTFDKYDTYTLGRFRQMGEQIELTVPVSSDLTVALTQGFGTGRDGQYNPGAPPPYNFSVGLSLLHYEHLRVAYKDYVDVGLHYNHSWTRDPNVYQSTVVGRSFMPAREAHVTTIGGEASLSAPYAGSLWVSPSHIAVKNGWAIGEAGIEVMHALSGDGLAANYLAWTGSLSDSTGSGSLFNLGFLYENSLSTLMGEKPGRVPDVTLNVFGLFADITLDLPETSTITQDRIGQFKYGADVELQALDWLAFMLRWDEVNYNLDHGGYVFSAITGRMTFSSHFLSGESIYLQYSRYRYGDEMVLAGKWPWGTPLVAGSDIIQGGTYVGDKPDMDVFKLQASVAF